MISNSEDRISVGGREEAEVREEEGWQTGRVPGGDDHLLRINSFTRGRCGTSAGCLLWTAAAKRSQG